MMEREELEGEVGSVAAHFSFQFRSLVQRNRDLGAQGGLRSG